MSLVLDVSDNEQVQVEETATGTQTRRPTKPERKKPPQEKSEHDLMAMMTKTIEQVGSRVEPKDDDITTYVKNLDRKLRQIPDRRALLIAQNDIDQVVFRATMGTWESNSGQPSVPAQQPLMSRPVPSAVHQMPTSSPTAGPNGNQDLVMNQNWAYQNFQSPIGRHFTSMLVDENLQ